MAQAAPINPFVGRWRITHMDEWDQEFVNAECQGYFEFDPRGTGEFHFGYVEGVMDCRLGTRDGQPCIEWTFDGNDEMDPTQGRGWAVIKDDELHGVIFFHQSDESGFKAKKVKPKTRKKPG